MCINHCLNPDPKRRETRVAAFSKYRDVLHTFNGWNNVSMLGEFYIIPVEAGFVDNAFRA
jgi:hypothetical protein